MILFLFQMILTFYGILYKILMSVQLKSKIGNTAVKKWKWHNIQCHNCALYFTLNNPLPYYFCTFSVTKKLGQIRFTTDKI